MKQQTIRLIRLTAGWKYFKHYVKLCNAILSKITCNEMFVWNISNIISTYVMRTCAFKYKSMYVYNIYMIQYKMTLRLLWA